MCHLNAFFAGYFYVNTIFHLLAVSYERYKAIVKFPLTYDGTVTKSRAMVIVLVWVIPIPFLSGPFIGLGKYVYNPEVFFCQRWTQPNSNRWKAFIVTALFALPFLIIVFLNWSVYKTAKHRATAAVIQIASLQGPEIQQQRTTRQTTEWKAAVDVIVIITAFLLCFLPFIFERIFHRFIQSIEVPAEAVQVASCVFMVSSVCNPIIYSIRKRDFRTAVKNMFRRIELC